jgi:hypothetical protein
MSERTSFFTGSAGAGIGAGSSDRFLGTSLGASDGLGFPEIFLKALRTVDGSLELFVFFVGIYGKTGGNEEIQLDRLTARVSDGIRRMRK